jgi:hypothetical protein
LRCRDYYLKDGFKRSEFGAIHKLQEELGNAGMAVFTLDLVLNIFYIFHLYTGKLAATPLFNPFPASTQIGLDAFDLHERYFLFQGRSLFFFLLPSSNSASPFCSLATLKQ